MNNLHLSAMNYNQRITSKYVFETREDMKEFVMNSKREVGIIGMSQNGNDAISVEFRDVDTKSRYDGIYEQGTDHDKSIAKKQSSVDIARLELDKAKENKRTSDAIKQKKRQAQAGN